jgi:hypothetical protein
MQESIEKDRDNGDQQSTAMTLLEVCPFAQICHVDVPGSQTSTRDPVLYP